MADGTIVNENDRTGVLDIQGEIARASAQVTEIDNSKQDNNADDGASGPEALAQSIESFTKPGGKGGPGMSAMTSLAAPKGKTIGPFQILHPTARPFTLMSPTLNLNARMKKGYDPIFGGPKGSKGKKKDKDHGKVGVVSAYGGGLQEISGAQMPSPTQLKTMALDPRLLEALQNEKRRMDDPNVVPGADQLNAQDFNNLKQNPEALDRANNRNATVQSMTNRPKPGF